MSSIQINMLSYHRSQPAIFRRKYGYQVAVPVRATLPPVLTAAVFASHDPSGMSTEPKKQRLQSHHRFPRIAAIGRKLTALALHAKHEEYGIMPAPIEGPLLPGSQGGKQEGTCRPPILCSLASQSGLSQNARSYTRLDWTCSG